MSRFPQLLTVLTVCLPAVLAAQESSPSGRIDGFTEPYRQVELAAGDSGLIASVEVEEGVSVAAGDAVARLDTKVLEASLEVAKLHTTSGGKLQSARAELRLRAARATKFAELLQRAHATQEEVDRARIEREVAEATVVIAEEERAVRQWELERITRQLERHTLRSPITGVVTRRLKEPGEYVSAADPVVAVIVQLDPLKVVFSVPSDRIEKLTVGGLADVLLTGRGETVSGRVEMISPVTDAQSDTIRVKIRIPNPQGELRSGEKAVLKIGGAERVAEVGGLEALGLPIRR